MFNETIIKYKEDPEPVEGSNHKRILNTCGSNEF